MHIIYSIYNMQRSINIMEINECKYKFAIVS